MKIMFLQSIIVLAFVFTVAIAAAEAVAIMKNNNSGNRPSMLRTFNGDDNSFETIIEDEAIPLSDMSPDDTAPYYVMNIVLFAASGIAIYAIFSRKRLQKN